MARSIDRLLRLARKTGDRLIIHDPSEERDIVIMDLDQYEMLVDAQKDLEEYIDDFQSYRDQFPTVQEERGMKNHYFTEASHTESEEEIPVSRNPHMTVMPELEEEVPPPLETYEESVSLPSLHEEEEPRPYMVAAQPETQGEMPAAKPVSHVGNWTPAVSLLEEKFRILTGQAEPRPAAPTDQEPRRVPMVTHEDVEQEFDEDDDEPIFLEEPV